MEKMIIAGVEIQFNDLSEQSQERLYLKEKEKFEMEVANSQYANIRRLLIKDEKTSSDTLDEIFKVETEIYGDVQNIVALWNHQNFEKNDEKRKVLATSDNWEIRNIAAEDEESPSKLLNEMLRNEIQGEQDEDVIGAILNNPKFQMEEETLKVLAKSEEWEYRLIAAKEKSASSEQLQEMYLTETDEDVLEAIELNLLQKISKTSITLNAIQKHQILNVLKELKHSKMKKPLSQYLEQILEIVG